MVYTSKRLYVIPVDFSSPEYVALVELRTEVLRTPLGLVFLMEDLAKEWEIVHFGCYDWEDNLLGTMQLKTTEEKPDVAIMKQVAVSPTLQNMGIGGEMVKAFEQYCLEKGYNRIKLHARDVAKVFYEKLGYKVVGEMFLEVGIPHYLMGKELV